MARGGTNDYITVGTTPVKISAAGRKRAGWFAVNSSAGDIPITLVMAPEGSQGQNISFGSGIYLAKGAGAADSNNGGYTVHQFDIYAVASAAGAKLSWAETRD